MQRKESNAKEREREMKVFVTYISGFFLSLRDNNCNIELKARCLRRGRGREGR